MRRVFTFITVCSAVALVATLLVWPLSYRTVVGHIWQTGTFLLEGKETVESHLGITASRGILRIEVFATREPADRPVEADNESRLQTTRIAVPLWCVVIVFAILPIASAVQRRKRGYDPQPN